MAKLAEQFQYVSGITWFDIYQRPTTGTPKTLSGITAEEWTEVGGFREGTFSFTGDEMEITSHKYENGQEIISTTTDGTYGFEGDLANVAEEICTNLLQMDALTLSAGSGAFVEGRKVLGAGKKLAVIENCMVRLRFEEGFWDSLVYPNCKISSRFQGEGASTELFNIHVNASATKSQDKDTEDYIYLFIGKNGSSVAGRAAKASTTESK